jgi:hypothetical protein
MGCPGRPGGEGPNISLNHMQRRSACRNRLHIDLYTEDREGEVERLLSIGKAPSAEIRPEGRLFRVLEDPDGNLFCVVQLEKKANG